MKNGNVQAVSNPLFFDMHLRKFHLPISGQSSNDGVEVLTFWDWVDKNC